MPKGRPRTATRAGKNGKPFATIYTDEKTASWEDKVGWWSRQELGAAMALGQVDFPLDGRLVVGLDFFFDKPRSVPKRVEYPQRTRTDVDNLAKAILDALQGAGIIKNDNAVTDLLVRKRWSSDLHPEGVEVDLTCFTSQ